VQRFFSDAPQSRDPHCCSASLAWAPAQQCGTSRRTASGAREPTNGLRD
jgi:hypothetical protein